MIKKGLISLLVMSIIFATGCEKGQEVAKEKIPRTPTENLKPKVAEKEVKIFDLAKDKAEITFYKTAIATSEGEVYVSPETTGKVVQVNVKVGDYVKKGQTLIILGDSVATQIADIQNGTANQSVTLAEESQRLTNLSAEQSWQMAYSGVDVGSAGLQNANLSKKDAQNLYEEQLDSAETSLEMAEDAYDAIKEYLDAGNPASPATDKGVAKDQEDLADNAVDILKKSFASQMHQMDYAIQMAFIQYRNSVKQLQAAQLGGGLQMIGAEMQTLQADSGAQIAQISANSKYIKAPISGVVTSLSADKGETLMPGISVAKVEDSQKLSITTGLNSYEAVFVKAGDKVKVEADGNTTEGEITSISPTLDAVTKKINVEILVNDPRGITPGSIAKIYFTVTGLNEIYIPLNAIYNREEGQYVKVAEGGKVAYKNVKMGEITSDYAEILEGLDGDEKVITSSDLFLDEGEAIKF